MRDQQIGCEVECEFLSLSGRKYYSKNASSSVSLQHSPFGVNVVDNSLCVFCIWKSLSPIWNMGIRFESSKYIFDISRASPAGKWANHSIRGAGMNFFPHSGYMQGSWNRLSWPKIEDSGDFKSRNYAAAREYQTGIWSLVNFSARPV